MAETERLEQLINLRDLAGLPTADGRQTRRGLVYRSAMLWGLTPGAVAALAALRLKTIVDLRADGERIHRLTPWDEIGCGDYLFRSGAHSAGDLAKVMLEGIGDADAVRNEMIGLYARLPIDHRETYQLLFARLTEQRTPLLIHCTAGKDRTGVAVALILSALGVAMDTIRADYLRTNAFDLSGSLRRHGLIPRGSGDAVDPKLVPLLTADADYLQSAFDAIDRSFGSVTEYLREALGVDEDRLERMRDHLLEPIAAGARPA